MKKALLIILPIALVLIYFSQLGGSSEEYVNEINKYWEEKHEFYRTSKASPFVERGVEYEQVATYAPDIKFHIKGKLDRFTTRELVTVNNSDGTSTKYLKFAYARFNIKDTTQSLLILKALGFGTQYLTAFGDETSGETTYGGGRYLDLEIGKSDQVTLDFNKAYNPYCAYFADFSCPLPPRENLLSVRIEAGEKEYPY